MTIDEFINRLAMYILNPAIGFLIALAILYFIYGIFVYIKDGDSEEGRSTGQKHMIWASVGIFIMISVYGIVRVVLNTLGIPN